MPFHLSSLWHSCTNVPPIPSFQYVMGIGCALLWTLTYVLIILQARKDRNYGMPFAAMCFNIMWEFIYTFVFMPDEPFPSMEFFGPLLMNLAWVALDVFVVITWLQYWHADSPSGLTRKWRGPGLALGLLVAAAVLIGFQRQYGDAGGGHTRFSWQVGQFPYQPGMTCPDVVPPGGYASFLQNLLMSALFVAMAMRRNSMSGQSLPIALAKGVGTVGASVFFYSNVPGGNGPYWVTLYVGCFLLDSIYVALLLRLHAKPSSA
jgi:hypothetical protein